MTKVVSVKVACIRPEYDNLKEWMKDTNNVYIGRRGVVFIDGVRFPPKDSIWANPFKINKDGDRDEVIEKYKKYIIDKLSSGKISHKELMKLKGKTLGCWCKDKSNIDVPCHGDVLKNIIDNCL